MVETECVFCEIVAGRLPARILYADDAVVSFLDIAPATVGHALVVPRAHRRDLWDIEDGELVAVSLAARKVARALRDVVGAPGMWLHHVSGAAAGQDVFHYHVHLIPRHDDDTVQPGWGGAPWRRPAVTEIELDGIAERVAAKLGRK
ncbi:MAG TPA: HIT domain-containing protein [Gaiellaceae bacterium]|jgi:histidine triad (HIT) family protein|nr:HIT domain-containing protein [Gaiellaceae bacterium]